MAEQHCMVHDCPCAVQVNPPYYVKLVELVPHPETAATVMDTTHALMTKVKIPDDTTLSLGKTDYSKEFSELCITLQAVV